jgi:hypothetical protein
MSQESELLRLMRYARETARAYSNGAALVARGIPVRMVQWQKIAELCMDILNDTNVNVV